MDSLSSLTNDGPLCVQESLAKSPKHLSILFTLLFVQYHSLVRAAFIQKWNAHLSWYHKSIPDPSSLLTTLKPG